ncbi:MAG: two-component system sensor histidine kinase NtrB [Planctomycetota bacterium]
MSDEPQTTPDSPPEDFFRRLFDSAAVAMIATDAAFRIVSWNDAASRLLGRDASDMVGCPLYDAVPPDRRQTLEKLLQRTVQRDQVNQLDIRFTGASEQPRDLLILLSPLPLDEDQRGVTAILVDHTASTRMSERLAQAEKMASLGTLAGGVAHHFNNILGGVATFVDYALTSGNVVAMKRALQMTAEAANRASRITQSLLSFAKHDQETHDLSDLTEVVLTFAHLVEEPLSDKDIHFELNLEAVPIMAVESSRMHQVLGNLLSNAEEAMPEGGTVTIGLRRVDEEVQLSFSDTGEGIAAKDRPLVFEPFFTTKGLLAGGNTANPGLGLSVVHGIIIDMGGRIEVDSRAEQGTTFRIYLPIPQEKLRE